MDGCQLSADLKAEVAQEKASKQEKIAYKYAPIECYTIECQWCRRKGSDYRISNGYAPLACRVLEGKERTREGFTGENCTSARANCPPYT